MKIKSITIITLISLASFVFAYKGKEFIQENIYKPMRTYHLFGSQFSIREPDLSQYIQSKCPENSITIATFGQSNSANEMTEYSNVSIPSNLYQFDWKSQKCFLYKEPLLGTSGGKGNVITYAATKMANNSNNPIVIISFGVGGTSVLDWAYGHLSHRHKTVIKRIIESSLSPRIFLWHQGESDSTLSEEVYYQALRKVVKSTSKSFPNSSFGIALATRCRHKQSKKVRSAQARIIQDLPNSFISADSDKIFGLDKRPDNCHFSAKGASELGSLYYESINREIK